MSGEAFDFRELMDSSSRPADSTGRPQCVVGVAWTGTGIGVVAISPEAARRTVIRTYNNIALGPIDSDWRAISHVIQLLPGVFHRTRPSFFLGGADEPADSCLPVGEEFERAFPGRVTTLARCDIRTWAAMTLPLIGTPQVPARDRWSIRPLHAAAETALFAGHRMAGSNPIGRPERETADDD